MEPIGKRTEIAVFVLLTAICLLWLWWSPQTLALSFVAGVAWATGRLRELIVGAALLWLWLAL